ncbi:MAG: hypothetical protein JNJ70_19080 [Verrucomicrobiales bacterium]|nr:hypothetical protein [Verrucomicrobiales bacterium]
MTVLIAQPPNQLGDPLVQRQLLPDIGRDGGMLAIFLHHPLQSNRHLLRIVDMG